MLHSSTNPKWELDIQEKLSEAIFEDSSWNTKQLNAGTYNQRTFTWLSVSKLDQKIPQSGWKIHISASIYNAEEILTAVLPILIKYPFNFKISGNLDFLAFLNSNPLSKSQAGKFITVYVHDTSRAIELASNLHTVTKHFKSPKIVTDQQFTAGSIVYYRYGAFTASYAQTLWGALMPVMEVNGEKHFDVKNPESEVLDSLINPFVKNHSQEKKNSWEKDQSIKFFKDGQILKCYRLLYTDTTETLLCLDTINRRRCIVKTVDVNSVTDSSGNDAAQRLKFEEAILIKLNSSGISPRYYESFYEDDEKFCLMMEDLPGENLHDFLRHNINSQDDVSINWLIALAINLATKMNILHEHKIIHADLKLGNVILLSDGEVKLIDFDSSSDMGSGKIISTCGSTGFSSKNRDRGLAPLYSDDIYSYGAILYYLFGGINPDICPLEVEQAETSLKYHQPEVPIFISSLINNCLNGTFKSFTEIIEAWTIQSDKAPKTVSHGQLNYKDKLRFLTTEYLAWGYDHNKTSFKFSQSIFDEFKISDLRGVAGSIIGISVASLAIGQSQELASDIKENAIQLLDEKLLYNPIPGFYVGESGKALAILYSAEALQSQELHSAALTYMEKINLVPMQSVDLFNGLAGRIRVNLIFWTITKSNSFYNVAQTMVRRLLELKNYQDGFITWNNPLVNSTPDSFHEDPNDHLLGYAHGIAGIGDALLDMYLISKDRNVRIILDEISECLIKKAIVTMDGQGIQWSDSFDGKVIPSFWCHGGAGIGLFLSRLMHYGIIPMNLELMKKILKPIIANTKGSAPILCHGVVGNLECLLDIYSYLPELSNAAAINAFENIISTWIRVYINSGFKSCNAQFSFYGYLTGVAGLLAVYSRLANPSMPNPLHLNFATYLLGRKK